MKVHHRSLVIELADDDPRTAIIEAVLFGRTLPPPFPAPPTEAPPASPVAPAVPDPIRKFWDALPAIARKELGLLAKGPHPPDEMEKALGLTQRELMGRHAAISRAANRFKLGKVIRAKGRGRWGRRFFLSEELVAPIQLLIPPEPPKPA